MGKHECPILDGSFHGGWLGLALGQMNTIRWALGALFLVLASTSFALDKTGVLAQSNGATTVVQPSGGGAPVSRTYGAGATSGEAKVMEAFNAVNPAGKTWAGTATRAFPWGTVAGLAVKGAMLAAGVAQAVYIAQALNEVRCNFATGAAAWACSKQAEPSNQEKYQYAGVVGGTIYGWYDSYQEACQAVPPSRFGAASMQAIVVNSTTGQMQCYAMDSAGNPAVAVQVAGQSNSTYGCQTGYSISGQHCYSDTETEPQTESQVQQKIQNSPTSQANAPQILQDAIEKQGQSVPDPAPLTVSGPTTSPGTTTTTTGPNGTTSSTTSYTNNYAGNTITYVTNNTTSVTNNAGDTTTTTTTSEPTPDKNPCELNPDTVGCAKLDKVDSPDLPTSEKSISVLPDSGWGADDSACPAPVMISIHGGSLPMSYEPYCNFMHGVRPVVLALAGLSAALILMGMRKAAED